MSVESFTSSPAVESCRLVPFDSFDIVETNPPQLVVRGEAPCLNMKVSLQPVVYIQCPEYWRIEVVGCLPGAVCLSAVQPYTVCISLDGIFGSEGIEVAGANQTKTDKVSGGCHGRLQCDVSV